MAPAIFQKYCMTDTWPSWRRISFAICYITIKTKICFKEHMKRGVHLLAHVPVGVKGRCGREIFFMLDGISVGKKKKRRETIHHCSVCERAFKYLPTPNQLIVWEHNGKLFSARVVARSLTPTTASTDTRSLCMASFTH